jgi:MFS superfamily sulfate permease-like transporter
MLPGAIAVVAITLCGGLLVVCNYAQKYGYKADGDQVLFAFGFANAAAALNGSMVTGNSVSRRCPLP